MSPANNDRRRAAGVVVLFLLGLICWAVIFGKPNPFLLSLGSFGPGSLVILLLAAIAVAVIPVTASWIDRALGRIRHPSSKARTLASVLIAVFSSIFLWWIARLEHRQFFPYIHDEFSYLIQAHQLAIGHLWLRGHPLAPFFESFQLFASPVYASAYFPGTALAYVPGIWLGWPPFVTSLILSGTVAGLLFWIVAELLDGVAGFLAVLLLLSDGIYRQVSIVTLGQMPLLFYSLIALAAWVRWRATAGKGWLIAIGFFLGLAAITRPVDALCFGIPMGVGVIRRQWRAGWFVILGAMPWLLMQLVLNHGVTGNWLQTPFGLYAQQEYPGSEFGFHHVDAGARPVSDLLQVRELYEQYRPMIERHRVGNILHDLLAKRLRYVGSQMAQAPFPVLILFLPFCLLGCARWVIVGTVPLFLLLYAFYVFFFPHYVLVCAPGIIVAIVAGAKTLGDFRGGVGRFTRRTLTLFIAIEAIAALPIWSPGNEDFFDAGLLADVNRQLSNLKDQRAVVLFKFDPKRDVNLEPVYNADTAWPDDAKIIRAHDRGAADTQLFQYYNKRDPGRHFYVFDENKRVLAPLGS